LLTFFFTGLQLARDILAHEKYLDEARARVQELEAECRSSINETKRRSALERQEHTGGILVQMVMKHPTLDYSARKDQNMNNIKPTENNLYMHER